MYRKILVALDGSEVSEQVLPYARFFAAGLKAPVVLLRAYAPPDLDWSDTVHDEYTFVAPKEVQETEGRAKGHIYLDQALEHEGERAQEYLDKVAGDLKRAKVQVTTKVEAVPAADAILKEANKDPLTLIIMGTHGRSGLARMALGSVADKVLHASGSPLLLVHALKDQELARRATVRNIVLPLDGSPLAEEALSTAAVVARSLDAKVTSVWAVPPAMGYYGDYMTYDARAYLEMYEETEKAAKEYLGRVSKNLTGAGVAKVDAKVVMQDPASAIIDLAQSLQDSLVVMTTHGRSGLGRWALGSVADKVVRHVGRPVLLLRSS